MAQSRVEKGGEWIWREKGRTFGIVYLHFKEGKTEAERDKVMPS